MTERFSLFKYTGSLLSAIVFGLLGLLYFPEKEGIGIILIVVSWVLFASFGYWGSLYTQGRWKEYE